MRLGFWMCIVLFFGFAVIGLMFGLFKEKSAKFVSGFHSLPKKEQDLYDKAYIARDMRNACGIWAVVMLVVILSTMNVSFYLNIV